MEVSERHLVALALLIGAATAACSPVSIAPPAPTQSAGEAFVIPPGAIPWIASSFSPYAPAQLPSPSPSPVPAPQCGTAELRYTGLDAVGATGNDGVVVELTNESDVTCLAQSYPRVTLEQPGHAPFVASSGGFFDGAEPIGDIAPHQMAAFVINGSYGCARQNPPTASGFTAVLPGGGTVSGVLSHGYAPGSNAMILTVPLTCGVYASHLYPYPVPQASPLFAPDPLAPLVATIAAPSHVRNGQPILYLITLHNPTAAPIALTPCRGYFQTLDGSTSPSSAYDLNCAAARPIPAQGDEVFIMELSGYFASGDAGHQLCWQLDEDGTQPPVCAELVIS